MSVNWHLCARESIMHVIAASSTSEGGTSWLCSGRESNGIQLMTKLIEGLMPAGTDKVLFPLHIYCMYISERVCVVELH